MHISTPQSNFSKVTIKLLSLLTLLILQTSFTLAQDAPFITVWQTDNPGSSEDNQITIPGTGTDYLIEWEEVGNEANNNGSETGTDEHTVTFPSAGTYRVKISGDFTGIRFPYQGDNEKILDIEQWGDIVWSRLAYAFYKCTNINQTASDVPDLANVTNMSLMFNEAKSFDGDIGNWDVSNVTDMGSMFRYANSFNGDIGNWDVSNVTDMGSMFRYANSFNAEIGDWDVSNVMDMSSMFHEANSFNGDIGNWDVSNVRDMGSMFSNANSFNGDIGNWDVSNVTDMRSMFLYANSFNSDIGNWDVSNVTNMSSMFSITISFNSDIGNWDVSNVRDMGSMFSNANSFNGDIGNWNVSNVTDMRSMFYGANSFNSEIGDWDVSNVTNMRNMLNYANSFNGEIGNWDVSNVTDMSSMFYEANSFIGEIGNWDVSNVTDMSGMFYEANSFNGEIGNWDVSTVTNMNRMFMYANSFNGELGDWDVSNVTDMYRMFTFSGLDTYHYDQTLKGWAALDNVHSDVNLGATNITYCLSEEARDKLVNEKGWTISGDTKDCESAFFVSTWKTDNEGTSEDNQITIPGTGTNYLIYWEEVDNTQNSGQETGNDDHTLTFPHDGIYRIKIYGDFTNIMFAHQGDKAKIIDIENWGDAQWTSMNSAFAGVKNLTISASDTPDLANVTDISYMFSEAINFNSNINNWDVSNVEGMSGVFFKATSFNQPLDNWNTSNVTSMSKMFREADAFNQDISDWNVANVIDISSMFYNATSFDQNLGNWNLSNASSLFEFLTNSDLSPDNYDLTLEGWAVNGNIPSDIALSAEGLYYCASVEYRQQLIDDFGWNIMGDETCSLVLDETYPAADTTSVEKDTQIYLTFDQEIEEIDFSGITLKDISGRQISLTDIYIDSLTLHLVHSGLGSNTYEVEIPESSIISSTGKENEAISWSFATQRILSSKDEQKPIDHSAFPNPFSDFTTIQFNLPKTQSVNLLVFDLKGQLVRKEQYDNLGSDNQSIKFERKDLPAGLYRYQLQSADGTVGGKMLVK